MVGEEEFDPEKKTQLLTMVAIRDSSSPVVVFPPINHENLHHRLHLPPSPSPSSSSSSSSFSPSDDSDESGPLSPKEPETQIGKCGGEVGSWVGVGIRILRSKVLGVVSSFAWEKVWSFGFVASVVPVVFMLWSFYLRARQRRHRRLTELIIREKDQKINKLLHQIAQMNEVLVARHRVLASKVAD